MAWKAPSRKTRAMPFFGPRRPIQRTSVPTKPKVASAPAVAETAAARLGWTRERTAAEVEAYRALAASLRLARAGGEP